MLCFLDKKFSTIYHIGLRDIMYVYVFLQIGNIYIPSVRQKLSAKIVYEPQTGSYVSLQPAS
jgi:hypothetical protein